MRYRITIDTAEKAATPMHDCGLFHMAATDEDVMAKAEAFAMIGFTPTVEIVTE